MGKFDEGKYDDVIAKVRSMTNARDVLTIIIDGNRGNGFGLHIGGVTRAARIASTKQMIVALAQVGQALIGWVERVSVGMTAEQIAQATPETKSFELQPFPERCDHCGATLPKASTSPLKA